MELRHYIHSYFKVKNCEIVAAEKGGAMPNAAKQTCVEYVASQRYQSFASTTVASVYHHPRLHFDVRKTGTNLVQGLMWRYECSGKVEPGEVFPPPKITLHIPIVISPMLSPFTSAIILYRDMFHTTK
jgi:hypothetical protein